VTVRKKRTLRENIETRLGRSMNEVVLRLPPDELKAMAREVREETVKLGLFYEDEQGQQNPIPLLMRPRVCSREQRRYFQKVCLAITRALERFYELWATRPEVKALLPLTPDEEKWFAGMPADAAAAPQSIFGRLDVQVDFSTNDWDTACHFFEPNSVGAGGIHYTAMAEQILLRSVVRRMQKIAPHFLLQPNEDPRVLLLQTLTAHADEIGSRRFHVGLVQDTRSKGGPEEFHALKRFLEDQGLTARVVDPRDLKVRGDELRDRDLPLDILYRDPTVQELAEYEREGADLSAMRWAFRQNRVVSSLAGDFDHKSTFEILSDPRFDPLWSPKQVNVFRQHIPWTRTLFERNTTDAEGNPVDLPAFVRKNREGLVLKPNRSFGGAGVVIGAFADLDEWESAIAAALKEPGSTVVQRYVPSLVKDFLLVDDEGRASLEEYYVVCGFYATRDGLGILGRASKKRVVNVAQKGALTACLVLL
jgi:hypothetical protein